MERIVIKVGSNVLTRRDGKLDISRMSALVDQIAWLRSRGYEMLLVSSGAITSGRGEMRVDHKLGSVEQRQLFSAIGQVKLINLYYSLFREYGIPIGQVLTMKESFSTRQEYLNQRACISVMLANGVLPIINENDTISVTELMFTDNDELSGLIASMMNAKTLIILSNIDGIFNGPPSDPHSEVIRKVSAGSDLSGYIRQEKSEFGRGGMITKYTIARKLADEGIRVVIANGTTDNILVRLIEEPETTIHTEFVPGGADVSGVKKWIAHSGSFSKGVIHINSKAAEALRGDKAVSLLLVGVKSIEGEFEDGDIVSIRDEAGLQVGVGRSAYSSEEAQRLIGSHGSRPIIHYDYLYIAEK